MLTGTRQDLWLAVPNLARRPGFSAAAIATLALGIGASTAIFSVAFGISLRPLECRSPDRLIRVYEANPANAPPKPDVSIPTFHAWREGAPVSLVGAAAVLLAVATLAAAGPAALAARTDPARSLRAE